MKCITCNKGMIFNEQFYSTQNMWECHGCGRYIFVDKKRNDCIKRLRK